MARILVIDDEEGSWKLLQAVLTRKRHHVFVAVNGQKGVNLFNRTRPLITLLGSRLPDMTGAEALARLRALDSQAYVIVLAGAASEGGASQAMQTEANDVLKKGFSLYELGETLRQALASARPSPASASRARAQSVEGAEAPERRLCRAS